MPAARRRKDLRRITVAFQHIGACARGKGRRRLSRKTRALEQREKFAWPEFVYFSTQLSCSIINRNPQTAVSVNQHFAMHVTVFDRRHARNEPAFYPFGTVRMRQVARNST